MHEREVPQSKQYTFCTDVGTAAQRNAGFQNIDKNSEYVCFIDDDVIVVPGWLDNIIALMENNSDIGAVQPVRFNYANKAEIDGLGYLMTHTGFPFRIQTTEESFCYQRRDMNTRIARLHGTCFVYLRTRGRLISMIRNYELKYLFRYAPMTIIIEVFKSILLLYYKPDHDIATFKGIFWVLAHLRYLKKTRTVSRKNLTRKNSNLESVFIKTSLSDLIKQFQQNWLWLTHVPSVELFLR